MYASLFMNGFWGLVLRAIILPFIRPKLEISLFPLTRPTLSKLADWNFFIVNLLSLFFPFSRFAQNSLCWKFRILDSFRQKIDIFTLSSKSLSSKKKKAYLPSKIVGWVRGNWNIFNCGLMIWLQWLYNGQTCPCSHRY